MKEMAMNTFLMFRHQWNVLSMTEKESSMAFIPSSMEYSPTAADRLSAGGHFEPLKLDERPFAPGA
jgi:hypothetical protein